MSFQSLDLGQWLLFAALVVLVSVFAVRLSERFGLPTLLVFLGLGVLLGNAWQFGVQFADPGIAKTVGFVALMLILTEGGLTTRWSNVRDVMPLGLTLATIGVAVSALLVAGFAYLVLGFEWQGALLLGAVTAPTDAAAVFSVLRTLPLPRRLAATLESESGLNDAPAIVLVTLLSVAGADGTGPMALVGQVIFEIVVGALLGAVVAVLGVFVLRRTPLPASGLSALAVFALAALAFGAAVVLHASGFAAVYIAALILGNTGLPYRRTTQSFAEGLAWLAQIVLFVMLGLLVSPSNLVLLDVVIGIVTGLVLTLVARPVAVAVSAIPFRVPWREQAFLSWAGLRGAVPIVLATIPMAAGVQDADLLFDVVFVLVVVFTVLQAPLLPVVAKRLGLSQAERMGELDVEVAPLETLDADLLEFRVRAGSRLAGVEVGELRLPGGASVSLVVRQQRALVPGPTTPLRVGDDVLVVVQRRARADTEDRLRAVSRGGKLVRWREIGAGRGRRPRR